MILLSLILNVCEDNKIEYNYTDNFNVAQSMCITTCGEVNKFQTSSTVKTCVGNCPIQQLVDENLVCIDNCSQFQVYRQHEYGFMYYVCQPSCNETQFKVYNTNICLENCTTQNMFKVDNFCVPNCTVYNSNFQNVKIKNDLVCKYINTAYYFTYYVTPFLPVYTIDCDYVNNYQCVTQCPKQTAGVVIKATTQYVQCLDGCAGYKYTYNNKTDGIIMCYDLCPFFVKDKDCLEECPKEMSFYLKDAFGNNQCIPSCPAFTVNTAVSNVTKQCLENISSIEGFTIAQNLTQQRQDQCYLANMFYDEVSQTCISECPSKIFSLLKNKFNKTDQTCIESCSTENIIYQIPNSSNQLCTKFCSAGEIFYVFPSLKLNISAKKCTLKCDSGMYASLQQNGEIENVCILKANTSYFLKEKQMPSCFNYSLQQYYNYYFNDTSNSTNCTPNCKNTFLKYFDGVQCIETCGGFVYETEAETYCLGTCSTLGMMVKAGFCTDSCASVNLKSAKNGETYCNQGTTIGIVVSVCLVILLICIVAMCLGCTTKKKGKMSKQADQLIKKIK